MKLKSILSPSDAAPIIDQILKGQRRLPHTGERRECPEIISVYELGKYKMSVFKKHFVPAGFRITRDFRLTVARTGFNPVLIEREGVSNPIYFGTDFKITNA